MKQISIFILTSFLFFLGWSFAFSQEWEIRDGSVIFQASTQIERFDGTTSAVLGNLSPDGSFRFEVMLDSIQTGNSTRDRKMREDHFRTHLHPKAIFTGQIVDMPEIESSSFHNVIARGVFSLHGVEQEMDIPGVLHVSDQELRIEASFQTRLSDFDISTPRFLFVRVRDAINVIVAFEMHKE